MSTIFGKPEIFWIALEAIGTILAFCLAFIFGLYALYQDKILPNLIASDCKIEFLEGHEGSSDERGQTIVYPIPPRIKISWRLVNKRRYFIFRRDASEIVTKWWLQKVSESEWKYSGQLLPPFPYLPSGKDFPQSVSKERESLEEAEYLLSLKFSINEKSVGGHKEILNYPHTST